MSLNCSHQQACCSYPEGIWERSPGGMISTGENRKTWRKQSHCHLVQTWTDPGLRGERPATNGLSHGTPKNTFNWDCICYRRNEMRGSWVASPRQQQSKGNPASFNTLSVWRLDLGACCKQPPHSTARPLQPPACQPCCTMPASFVSRHRFLSWAFTNISFILSSGSKAAGDEFVQYKRIL
jgi:hypothetical protein